MLKMTLTTPSGHETVVASHIDPVSAANSLKSARRMFFGKQGKISYTLLNATCNGAILQIVKEQS